LKSLKAFSRQMIGSSIRQTVEIVEIVEVISEA